MKLLTIFIYLIMIGLGHTSEKPDIKNLILTKNLKIYENVIFRDVNQKDVNLDDYKGKLLILNFWATWCAPCKEEMPSLDRLVDILGPEYIEIIAVNVETVDYKKSKQFLDDLKVKNFDSYFDKDLKVIKTKVLDDKHISLIFKSKVGFSIKSISFNSVNTKVGDYLLNYKKSLDVLGQINENIWNNKKTLQLTIRDVIL